MTLSVAPNFDYKPAMPLNMRDIPGRGITIKPQNPQGPLKALIVEPLPGINMHFV